MKLLMISLLSFPALAWALDGASLFDNRCSLCHQDTTSFKELDRRHVETVLRSGKIDEHRFTLSQEEIDALAGYLTGNQ